MLNFVQALFRRPQPQQDAGEVNRLRQMRQRSNNNVEVQLDEFDEPKSLRDSGTLHKNNVAIDVTNRVAVGRGNAEQSQGVQQKWIDECGFKMPKTKKP